MQIIDTFIHRLYVERTGDSISRFLVVSSVSSLNRDVVCLVRLAVRDIVTICQFPGQTNLVTLQTSLGQ